MIKIFILILTFASGSGYGTNSSMITQEFNSLYKCQQALAKIRPLYGTTRKPKTLLGPNPPITFKSSYHGICVEK